MSDNFSIFRPAWFNDLDPDKRDDRLLMNRFFIRDAALLATPEGSLKGLAAALNVSEVMLCYTYNPNIGRGKISPNLALRLQHLFGPERMPAKLLLPDTFKH